MKAKITRQAIEKALGARSLVYVLRGLNNPLSFPDVLEVEVDLQRPPGGVATIQDTDVTFTPKLSKLEPLAYDWDEAGSQMMQTVIACLNTLVQRENQRNGHD